MKKQQIWNMEINVSGGRFLDATVMPNGACKLTVEIDGASSLILPDNKLVVPEKKIIHPKELECQIDPLMFPMDADWLQYEPKTRRQKETKDLFLDARAKGRLHSFTCMVIDPSIDPDTGKVVYQPGLPPAIGKSYNWWVTAFKNYAPSRNSRVLARTEGVCKNLEIIKRLVEWKKWAIDEAWYAVCDDSRKLGHYRNSDNPKKDFELTGSREVCGFYDLGNAYKMLADDPWNESGGFWAAGGYYCNDSYDYPLDDLEHDCHVFFDDDNGLGMLALDW